MKQHEFGHVLQYAKYGGAAYWGLIAPFSMLSIQFADEHRDSASERGANTLANEFFGTESLLGGPDYPLNRPPNATELYMRFGGLH